MLKPAGKRESLAGKLLLSSALVAVSLAYGWWQRPGAERPNVAMTPAPLPLAPKSPAFIPPSRAITPTDPAVQTQTVTSDDGSASVSKEGPSQAAGEPRKSPAAAKAAVQTIAPPAVPEPPPQNREASSSPVSAAPVAPAQIVSPADDTSSLFLVTGTPDPAAKSPVPAGAHLEDGDYVSSRHQFMWGDLRVKIFVRGGVITGVQALEFPDHRSQSLYLSGLAIPKLESEVIKNQTAQVDTVSSATDTSIVFQDAVADAIVKATRG